MKNQCTECAICLSEFSEEDTVRLITMCRHGFHSVCIDLWFESHKTCPVCRCELDPGLVGSGSHESLHSTVTITIQDLNHDQEDPPSASSSKRLTRKQCHVRGNAPSTSTSSSKRLREALAWRFSRSHSTGHFMGKAMYVNELSRYEAAEYGMAW
ncbi:unnamed protein product [Brassica oleracea]|uniref:RING-type domain-containing protein n=3 Tax=Brassica TaxID=3705 RepID=A0A0D3BRW8_BRAOL|nr:hypothetical protein F2Q69_00011238 [Brassica cretica]VDD06302.1 unnamed protein product [Brassica oleracea]